MAAATAARADTGECRRRFAVDGRARSGCLTCKARKKKCDREHSPVDDRCGSCSRLGLVCQWAPLRIVQMKPRARRKKDVSPKPRSDKDEAVPMPTECDDTRAARVPSPACGDPSPPMPNSWGAAPHRTGYAERLLLQYYLEKLVPLCSILQQGTNNAFCTVLLPMAIADSTLFYSLLTYASVHISTGTVSLEGPVSPLQKLEFESQAARGLAEAITQNIVSESTIACALVSSTAAVVSGDTSRWNLHLQGAGHLIQHVGTPRLLQTPDGAFLLRNFAYHDIMASLSTGRRPLFPGVYWTDGKAISSVDCLMGLAHDIFGFMSRICTLIADSMEADNARDLVAQGEDLAKSLRLHDLDFYECRSDETPNALTHHAEAFRFAALLHLYRFLSGFDDLGGLYMAEMEECVDSIISHVSNVPISVYCEVGLLFPLFMAGVAAGGNPTLMEYVGTRLHFIESWTGFKSVARVLELLSVLWADGRTDWEILVEELGWHVSLA